MADADFDNPLLPVRRVGHFQVEHRKSPVRVADFLRRGLGPLHRGIAIQAHARVAFNQGGHQFFGCLPVLSANLHDLFAHLLQGDAPILLLQQFFQLTVQGGVGNQILVASQIHVT